MSFMKGFFSIFDWMFPKTLNEQLDDLDNKMQDLYDRMGWGKYNFPIGVSNTAIDINRVLEAEQSFMDEIYGYNTRQITTTIKKTFSNKRDPARPRISQCYGRQRYK